MACKSRVLDGYGGPLPAVVANFFESHEVLLPQRCSESWLLSCGVHRVQGAGCVPDGPWLGAAGAHSCPTERSPRGRRPAPTLAPPTRRIAQAVTGAALDLAQGARVDGDALAAWYLRSGAAGLVFATLRGSR